MAWRLLHLQEQSIGTSKNGLTLLCEKVSSSGVLGEEMQELPCQGAGGDVVRLWGLPGPGMALGTTVPWLLGAGCDCAPAVQGRDRTP